MTDFFDQDTGNEREDVPMGDNPNGPTALINGSHRPLEVGADFMGAVKSVALQAGLGKFKVWLNGTELRPSSAPKEVAEGMRVEIRPYDEAG